MKESFWGIFVVFIGITSLVLIVLFQNLTNTDQHNSQLLEEVTEAAMKDAIDLAEYRATGNIKITREKFVENFIRRYAESASRSRKYEIVFYDINELPPKATVAVKSGVVGAGGSTEVTFNLSNKIDAILEAPY